MWWDQGGGMAVGSVMVDVIALCVGGAGTGAVV